MLRLLAFLALLSAAQGFVVPAEFNVVFDKLPSAGENDPLELLTKTAVVPLILYAPFYQAGRATKLVPMDEIDFDAPLDRQLKVDHIVRRQPFTLGFGDQGTYTPPTFLQQALNLYEPEHAYQLPSFDEEYFSLVDDECYLGKDFTAQDCVDFDPMHKGRHNKIVIN
ncbi:hypothetical protein ACHAXT_012271 [Thalassiosira profunda]